MKIALLGYGKMGKTIEGIAIERGHEIVLKVDDHNKDSVTTKDLSKADVAIEFSTPQSAYNNILLCFEANIPIVVGTTAWLDKLGEVKKICKEKNQAFFHASNFSIGVNLFFQLNKKLATMMSGYKQYIPSMEEIHHTEKLDSPSGTAISLANDLIAIHPEKKSWVNSASGKTDELSIISKREPNVPGTHTISYTSDVDTIEIKHTAHSRKGFAEGAVIAAEWLIGKKGCYTMNDMLNF